MIDGDVFARGNYTIVEVSDVDVALRADADASAVKFVSFIALSKSTSHIFDVLAVLAEGVTCFILCLELEHRPIIKVDFRSRGAVQNVETFCSANLFAAESC